MPPNTKSPIDLQAVVLPALADDGSGPCERERWLDTYDCTHHQDIPGVADPLQYTSDGLGILSTGVGKANAAASVAALCTDPEICVSDAYFLSVGIAGVSPQEGTIGSVFLADVVADWDCKYRVDPGDDVKHELWPFEYRSVVRSLNKELVEIGRIAANSVGLLGNGRVADLVQPYTQEAATAPPSVGVGTTVTSDEFWHGSIIAHQVGEWLEHYDVTKFATTQMEDWATALTLDRFGHLDRYLSVRAASNFDRPPTASQGEDTVRTIENPVPLEIGLENAFRVGSAIVDTLLAD